MEDKTTYQEVKDYVMHRSDEHKAMGQRSHKPTLRRKPKGDEPGPQDDDRPTLRRRLID